MEKLTVERALEESIRIWTYLSETGGFKSAEDRDKYKFGCPLCTYVLQNGITPDGDGGRGCDDICPVTWTRNRQACGDINSPYWVWRITDPGSRSKKAAKKVLALLQETLEQVRRKENGKADG